MALTSTWTLPAPVPLRGGLLAAANPLSAQGWERGVQILSGQCLSSGRYGSCDIAEVEGEGPSGVDEFEAFGIRRGVICSALSGVDVEKLAAQALEVAAEFQIARELENNQVTSNPDLTSGTALGALDSSLAGLACLDSYLGTQLEGAEGTIHMNPGHLPLVNDGIFWDGSFYRTYSGNRIAASPGYAALDTFYGTGPVFAAFTRERSRSAVDRSINNDEAWSDGVGLAVFDSCLRVKVTVPALCDFES